MTQQPGEQVTPGPGRPLRVMAFSLVSSYGSGVPDLEPACRAALDRLRSEHGGVHVERFVQRGAGRQGGRDRAAELVRQVEARA